MNKPVVIVGSINMDLVCRVARRPVGGETVLGEDLQTVHGGKGANQAVAVARLGGRVEMVGRVGDDDFGRQLLDGLRADGVGVGRVGVTPGVASGCAVITVDGAGENAIVVSPGANGRLTPADVLAARDVIAGAGVVVLQLEVPMETVVTAAEVARAAGVPVIVDPAPAPVGGLPAELWRVDVITPNEHEAASLVAPGPAEEVAGRLLGRGPGRVFLKLGAAGGMVAARDRPGATSRAGPEKAVRVVDTTGAGDAFTAALAVSMVEGADDATMLKRAVAAGGAACGRAGARPSMPRRAEVGW